MAFKFPVRCHFGFYDVNALRLLLGSRGSFVGNNYIGQRIDVINSKMAACRKFKSDNRFRLLLELNAISPLCGKICELGTSTSTCLKSRGSLEV